MTNKRKPRSITPAMKKRAFRTLARWIAEDDARLKAFIKALRRVGGKSDG